MDECVKQACLGSNSMIDVFLLIFAKINFSRRCASFGIFCISSNKVYPIKVLKSFRFEKKRSMRLKTSSEKVVPKFPGTPSGIFWHCMIIDNHNSYLDISNTLLFLNLERGADLGRSCFF